MPAPRLRPALAAILAALALAPAAIAQSTAQEQLLPDLEDEVMCPVCGTTLGLADSPQANSERDFIRGLIRQGMTKDEIKDALVAEYGSEVIATPETGGFDLAAWLVPGVALLLVAGGIVVGARRWRRSGRGGAGADPDPTIAADDEERLRTDIGKYEL